MTTSSRAKKEMKQNNIHNVQQLKITNSLRHETIALKDISERSIIITSDVSNVDEQFTILLRFMGFLH